MPDPDDEDAERMLAAQRAANDAAARIWEQPTWNTPGIVYNTNNTAYQFTWNSNSLVMNNDYAMPPTRTRFGVETITPGAAVPRLDTPDLTGALFEDPSGRRIRVLQRYAHGRGDAWDCAVVRVSGMGNYTSHESYLTVGESIIYRDWNRVCE